MRLRRREMCTRTLLVLAVTVPDPFEQLRSRTRRGRTTPTSTSRDPLVDRREEHALAHGTRARRSRRAPARPGARDARAARADEPGPHVGVVGGEADPVGETAVEHPAARRSGSTSSRCGRSSRASRSASARCSGHRTTTTSSWCGAEASTPFVCVDHTSSLRPVRQRECLLTDRYRFGQLDQPVVIGHLDVRVRAVEARGTRARPSRECRRPGARPRGVGRMPPFITLFWM